MRVFITVLCLPYSAAFDIANAITQELAKIANIAEGHKELTEESTGKVIAEWTDLKKAGAEADNVPDLLSALDRIDNYLGLSDQHLQNHLTQIADTMDPTYKDYRAALRKSTMREDWINYLVGDSSGDFTWSDMDTDGDGCLDSPREEVWYSTVTTPTEPPTLPPTPGAGEEEPVVDDTETPTTPTTPPTPPNPTMPTTPDGDDTPPVPEPYVDPFSYTYSYGVELDLGCEEEVPDVEMGGDHDDVQKALDDSDGYSSGDEEVAEKVVLEKDETEEEKKPLDKLSKEDKWAKWLDKIHELTERRAAQQYAKELAEARDAAILKKRQAMAAAARAQALEHSAEILEESAKALATELEANDAELATAAEQIAVDTVASETESTTTPEHTMTEHDVADETAAEDTSTVVTDDSEASNDEADDEESGRRRRRGTQGGGSVRRRRGTQIDDDTLLDDDASGSGGDGDADDSSTSSSLAERKMKSSDILSKLRMRYRHY